MEYTPGDIAFYAGDTNDAIDRLIMGAQAAAGLPAKYVHVGFIVSPHLMVEAVAPLARITVLRKRPPAATASPAYRDEAARMLAVESAAEDVGVPYAIFGVTGYGVSLWYPKLAERIRDVEDALGKRTLWCSEVVAAALIAAGVPGFDTPYISPGHLAQHYGVA